MTATPGPATVVVCSRDRADQLERCLADVRSVLRAGDRLVVVDSASADRRTAHVGRAAGADVVRVDLPGLSRARNAGLAAAQTEVVLFTDDDCRPLPGWVDAVVAAFAVDDRTGFVTGQVLPVGGGAPTSVLLDETPRLLDASTPLNSMGHGANMSLRVSAARAVGGFDPLLGAGSALHAGEDTDMYRRLVAAGWHGRFAPAAQVTHEQWRSRPQAVRMAYRYGTGFGAVAAKTRRSDDALGRFLLRTGVVDAGLGQGWRDLRSGYEFGVLVCGAWTVGVAAGFMRTRRLGVVDDLLVRPSGRSR